MTLNIKGNQGHLNDDVHLLFSRKPKTMGFVYDVENDKGHVRIEQQVCTVSEDIEWLRERYPDWSALNSVVEIESTREIKGEVSIEKRYYIRVENKLHWVLDMTFHDDQSRIRKGNAPRNIAIVKKTLLNLLQTVKACRPRISLKQMRKLAGWDSRRL